jgi:hypothetical protein
VKKRLEEAFPGIVVSGAPTQGTTGAFEVENNRIPGRIYHSKLGGEGLLHSNDAKMKDVIEAIRVDREKLAATPTPAPSA